MARMILRQHQGSEHQGGNRAHAAQPPTHHGQRRQGAEERGQRRGGEPDLDAVEERGQVVLLLPELQIPLQRTQPGGGKLR